MIETHVKVPYTAELERLELRHQNPEARLAASAVDRNMLPIESGGDESESASPGGGPFSFWGLMLVRAEHARW
jgi:hypothetical protein